MPIGDVIRELRKQRGETQEQLAAAIGVERSSIGKYEGKSKISPDDDVKRRLADHFGVSMDFLFERTAPADPLNLTVEEHALIIGIRSNPQLRDTVFGAARLAGVLPDDKSKQA